MVPLLGIEIGSLVVACYDEWEVDHATVKRYRAIVILGVLQDCKLLHDADCIIEHETTDVTQLEPPVYGELVWGYFTLCRRSFRPFSFPHIPRNVTWIIVTDLIGRHLG